MLAFAGKGKPSAPALRSTLDSLESFQTFGVGSISYEAVFFLVCGVIFFFVLAFAVQEKVEERRFLNPHSMLWKAMWLAMSNGTKLVAVSMLLPMLRVLVEAFDCDFGAAQGSEWPAKPGTTCYNGQHIPFVIVAAILVALYMPLAYRFLRVRGILSGIELRHNPLDWRGDRMVSSKPLHAMALRSHKYWLTNMVCKTALTVVGVLLTSEVVAISIVQLVTGIFLFWWGTRHPPYYLSTYPRMPWAW